MLRGQTALVTGASRGIGRGIALQLGEAGATVYVTGRAPAQSDGSKATDLPTLEKTANEITSRGGKGIAVYCDHANDDEVEQLFERIAQDTDNKIDILVNNAYAAVNLLTTAGGKPFWELDRSVWDQVNAVGLRNHYLCSWYAARMMVPRKSGLIVTVSSGGGLQYLFNVAYGVGKQACDRLAADMAVELKRHNVTSISLWPGAVKTELITKNVINQNMDNATDGQKSLREAFMAGESIEFSGKVLVAFAADKNRMNKTGRIVLTADLGSSVDSIRSVKYLLQHAKWNGLASYMPAWVRVPGWVLTAATSKL